MAQTADIEAPTRVKALDTLLSETGEPQAYVAGYLGSMLIAIEGFLRAGHPELALDLIDSTRKRLHG